LGCKRVTVHLTLNTAFVYFVYTADMRYMVLSLRPAGTGHFTEAQLVTRDTLIGVTLIPAQPSEQT